MIEFISEEDLLPIRFILPLRETFNESSIVWDEYHFNNALLGPVPEEGVSRLVTQQISERQDHYVRGGLAFMIEHGFWRSEKGRQNYALQLTQIKNATLDGLYVGVLEALLMCKNVTNYYIQTLQHTFTRNRLERSLKLEVEAWAEVQKTPNGWDMLNSRAHKALKLNGFVPDCWVVDEGTKRYVATVCPENSQYFLGGPEGKALYNSALPASSNPKLLDQKTGCLIFETKSFESPDAREPVNPMSRPRAIGEYNYSGPFHPVMRHTPYYSASRTIVVYDESRDGWAHISLLDGLNHCMRFSPKNPEKDEFYDGFDRKEHHFFYDDYPHTLDGLDPTNDMFMCHSIDENNVYVSQFIGDISDCIDCTGMTKNGLPDEAINDWANSVIQDLDPQTEKALRDLKHLIYKIENEYNDDDTNGSSKYFTEIYKSAAEHGLTDAGLVTFDDMQKNGYTIMCWPHGFSSCVGLDYLAKDIHKTSASPYVKEAHEIASAGMKAFDNLYARLQSVCYDNCFFNEGAVPDYYKRKEGRYAFFSNLFHAALPALILPAIRTSVFAMHHTKLSSKGGGQIFDIGASILFGFFPELRSIDDIFTKKLIKLDNINELFDMLVTQESKNKEKLSFSSKKEDYDVTARNPDHLSIYQNLQKQFHDASLLAMQSLEERIQLMFTMLATLFGVRFSSENMKFTTFLLFLDKVTCVKTFEEFSNILNTLLTCNVNDIETDDRNYETKGLFTDTYNKKKLNFLTKLESTGNDVVSAMVMSNFLQKKRGKNCKITQDYTQIDDSRFERIYGYTYGVAKKRRYNLDPKLGLVASFESLPAVIGSAAFAQIESMPADAGNLSTASRFNFDEGADKQRVMNENTFPRAGILHKPSKQFMERFNDINREPDVVIRVVKQALLGVPLTKRALEHFIKRDVVFPFNMLYFRPYMTYNMSTAVCLKAGAGTGETLVGQSDFQMGDDVQRKVHFGHYTIKYKSVVYNERAVYHAHDYMCTGYIGGNDARFVTRDSLKKFSDSSNDPEHFHSIFACLVPYQRTEYPNPMDITGNFFDKVSGESIGSTVKHYASASFYSKYWNWINQHCVSPQEAMYTSERSCLNTVCFQGHQAMFSPSTLSYTQVIENSGHWGRNVYPGVGKVRAGLASAIQQVAYAEPYGGATQKSRVML